MNFKLTTDISPKGDQQKSINELTDGLNNNFRQQTLLGVTGSGKTFTMAGIIANAKKPTLVIAHNKTLASQLCSEFKSFFPQNAVEYFVSYYDYYKPEAYIASTDTYLEKKSAVNDELDKLRHAATSALAQRNDVIIVASVSCIYNLGNPFDYKNMILSLNLNFKKSIRELTQKLIELQYKRSSGDFERGNFRTRESTIDIYAVESYQRVIRVEIFKNTIKKIFEINPLTGENLNSLTHAAIYPASHYVIPKEKIDNAIFKIEEELKERIDFFLKNGKTIEARRIRERTMYDIEMLREIGFCKGIENYSKILSGGTPGEPPFTLFDFFPKDFLTFIDESHITIPQINAMYSGDRSRKQNLVENGFRLLSAFDNRPLTFDEFYERINKVIFVSATPGDFEIKISQRISKQIIRPTGLVDPKITIMPIEQESDIPYFGIKIDENNFLDLDKMKNKSKEKNKNYDGQINDLIKRIKEHTSLQNRVLITTLTKKMAENLSSFLENKKIKVCYMHSDTETIERMHIIRKLRQGIIDVLIGINLLREGLDIPEVSLVAIMDADKVGFLRSHRSLIQIIGRAARNQSGEVVMYADVITESMKFAIEETYKRRKIQIEFNIKNNIIPQTIRKPISEVLQISKKVKSKMNIKNKKKLIKELTIKMDEASEKLDFEEAAFLRDEIKRISL